MYGMLAMRAGNAIHVDPGRYGLQRAARAFGNAPAGAAPQRHHGGGGR
ncbi:hypothetical protein BSU04_05385 [Caballeronia sordidicola]|uniref:Uncharacterized protein n=1 Tax=Caballeronia sordidicola TaxID=196367 RepID=A0A226X8B2_CABSO|nr:hypothetical protein BSU04_05385 [Caballeronia sordidicola]